ncbi:forespore capture DNA-binding protein RefZ [Bacillus lacus]|uniref:Forespore capture DNA-binding protein RefZ n=1 Tax=Metabacillus lacus TaxID=1983721 RepID=A0A7X2IZN0_9BACI|nr:forespore capture DNA-binding protein RefZ [Metabacillus lacus]MRX72750.1 forespore capture DNA-binding protein RefZ [Metabacillus lacus]
MNSTAASANTKQKIIDAAVFLFHTKGFTGTSVREIANKANANVAHISYYFKSKNGLLEFLVQEFFEGYLAVIEKGYARLPSSNPKDCLQQLVLDILIYQHEHRQLARIVHREVTLDSILIREVMVTYLTKEKYYLKFIIEQGKKLGMFRNVSSAHMILQLKSLLHMPYLQPQYMAEVLHIQSHEVYFVTQYYKDIEIWLDSFCFTAGKEDLISQAR